MLRGASRSAVADWEWCSHQPLGVGVASVRFCRNVERAVATDQHRASPGDRLTASAPYGHQVRVVGLSESLALYARPGHWRLGPLPGCGSQPYETNAPLASPLQAPVRAASSAVFQ